MLAQMAGLLRKCIDQGTIILPHRLNRRRQIIGRGRRRPTRGLLGHQPGINFMEHQRDHRADLLDHVIVRRLLAGVEDDDMSRRGDRQVFRRGTLGAHRRDVDPDRMRGIDETEIRHVEADQCLPILEAERNRLPARQAAHDLDGLFEELEPPRRVSHHPPGGMAGRERDKCAPRRQPVDGRDRRRDYRGYPRSDHRESADLNRLRTFGDQRQARIGIRPDELTVHHAERFEAELLGEGG